MSCDESSGAVDGAELVIRDPSDRQEVFVVLDRHDELMIVEEMQRRVLDVMLYDFPMDGSQVVDLSVQGVNECVRVMNATGKCHVTIDRTSLVVESMVEDVGNGPEPCYTATVYAVDDLSGYGQYGTFVQPKRIKLKKQVAARKRSQGRSVTDDDSIADPFSRQKAINKAQRNALRAMIPEHVRQTLIAQYKGDEKRIRVIKAGAGAELDAELPPPLTDDRALALKDEIRGLYDELREINRLALLPGRFNVMFRRVEHEHAGMEEFRDYLSGLAQHEKEKAV
jgi:hypothetical protein